MNKKKILHFIKDHEGQSRADIAKALSVSKPTTSKVVDELLEEGWIKEKEGLHSSSSGGRKPNQIHFNRNAKYIVGIDIGGTTVEIAMMNLQGDFIRKTSFSTQEHLPDDIIQVICDHVTSLLADSGLQCKQIMGAGVGVPGITDVDQGVVFDAPSLRWRQYPLKEKLEQLLPFPVYVDNDVNIAVLGEQWKGAGKNKSNIIQITLGTGVGCGIIVNGQLYRGSAYAAGEIGYMVTDKNAAGKDYDSIFSGYGFLDSHVGGPSVTRKMLNRLGIDPADGHDWSAKKVFEMAMDGDDSALEIVNDSLSHLAFALINVITIFNPECVVLGGGISKSGHWFLPKVQETINRHLPMKTEVTITKLEYVSLLGAANLLLKEHESILKR